MCHGYRLFQEPKPQVQRMGFEDSYQQSAKKLWLEETKQSMEESMQFPDEVRGVAGTGSPGACRLTSLLLFCCVTLPTEMAPVAPVTAVLLFAEQLWLAQQRYNVRCQDVRL